MAPRRTRPGDRTVAPVALPSLETPGLPETLRYRLKNAVLGPPLASERQSTERLGKPTALAVLSSDVISSSAYATEQILLNLVKYIGVAAFSLVIGVSAAVIVVLFFVTLSYLEVVKVYTKAGGAYVVARENFGPNMAQIAAMSLLIDYTLTVAVSVAAGVAALTSVYSGSRGGRSGSPSVFVMLIAYGNLRGVREAGRVFALPTYFFIVNMVILIGVGIVKDALGDVHAQSLHQPGAFHVGTPGGGLLAGASLFVVMRAFASGGSALTGTEAISNGVSVFRQPEARNARQTLVLMSVILGSLVMGVAFLASVVHPVPYPRHADGRVPDRQVRLRQRCARAIPLRRAAGRDDAHPGAGGQHQLHRLPLPGQLRRRGLLPAAPADAAWAPTRVLDRDHRADGGRHRAAARDTTPRSTS